MRSIRLATFAVVGAAAISVACGGGSSPTPITATKVAFTVQPGNTLAGGTIAAVKVALQDANGTTATGATDQVTLAIGNNAGPGTLSGTLTVPAVSGVATFSNLSIDNPGTGYTLTASSGSLTGATSSGFNITAPPTPTKVGFTVQPSNTVAGATIAAVKVAIQDVNGVTITTSTAVVTMAIGNNAGPGTLSGTFSVPAVNGVATFSDLSIDNVGTGYTLAASSGVLTAAASSAFNVTPAPVPTKLGFTVQPSNTLAGGTIAAVKVAIQDVNGVTITTSTAAVTMAIGNNAGPGTLSGTFSVPAVNGVATFSDLSIDNVGTGYTLTASSGILTGATSNAFNVTAAPPGPVQVQVGNFFFMSVKNNTQNPAIDTVSIASGKAVQWTWVSTLTQHSILPTGTPPGPFTGSGAFQTSGTYSFTFSVAGTYTYECGVHLAAMTGTVVVVP